VAEISENHRNIETLVRDWKVLLGATHLFLAVSTAMCGAALTRCRGSVDFMYSVNCNCLKTFGDSVVHLGITFDRHLCFHSHIKRVTCKALKMLGFVKRTSLDFKLFTVNLYMLTWNIA